VDTALGDYNAYRDLRREAEQASKTLRHLTQAEFSFRSPAEALDIATLLASACPDGQRVVVGLSELLLNAVEHGNLAITYDEKTALIADDRLHREVELRLQLPRFADRRVRVNFERGDGEIRFLIEDEGAGFDWRPFLQMEPERAFHNHGRGIAVATAMSFSRVEYQGRGNRVLAAVTLSGP
jgi:anti-sigma regulatory factor (Ser/Thr protein kinase)